MYSDDRKKKIVKAIIFDCFGVFYLDAHSSLVENFPSHQEELGNLRRQADYGFLDRAGYIDTIARLTSASHEELERIILHEHQINKPLIEYISTELKPYYKIGLLSNIGRGWIQNFFDEQQLHGLFDAVVLSGDEGITKPHPQIYELMAEKLFVQPEECIMIDDLPENAAGADAAGMEGIVYGNLRDLKRELSGLLK